MHGLPLTATDIAKAMRKDPVYGQLLLAVKSGVYDRQEKLFKPYLQVIDSLTAEADCLHYGNIVVVPSRQQNKLLFELHHTHIGIVNMKTLAKKYDWWPSLDKDIESVVASCVGCSKFTDKSPMAPLIQKPWATWPMERLHVDVVDYKGVKLLLVIDAFTKFMWTYLFGRAPSTTQILRVLHSLFAGYGIPNFLVSPDNSLFISQEFSEDISSWCINHVKQPLNHLASNGIAKLAASIVTSSKDGCFCCNATSSSSSNKCVILVSGYSFSII
ncbi:unnamed protein product [Meganyctiphanes norvegica]|uniref:RNA-directed DNA polymerase n=1 Tax=Meganyctiphanes norvegica TaxID=48144 RepID=A0AAV2QWD0_MEGNR